MTVAELCDRHRRIGVDSNVVVYVLEGVEPWGPVARELLNRAESRTIAAALSVVGLAEVCAGPARRRDFALVERYAEALGSLPGLRIQPLTAEVAVDAAIIRGARGIALPDAIQLATARAAGATAFVTNDRSLRGSTTLEVVYLDDLVLEPAPA